MKWTLILPLIFFLACSPQYPKDAKGSLNRMKGHTLRVGIAHNPPYTMVSDSAYNGTEVTIIKAYAQKHQARIEWRHGTETLLARSLKNFELDVMVCGLVKDAPVLEGLGVTQPYIKDFAGKHVIATAPGENALLTDLDQFLVQYKTQK